MVNREVPDAVRFGEKGPLWLEFVVRTPGAHGAYTHASKSATKIAVALAAEIESVTEIQPTISDNIGAAIERGRATAEKAMGAGAADTLATVTLNIGTIHGGLKVNMVPGECKFEADIRLPIGVREEGARSLGDPATLPGGHRARDRRKCALLV